ncbi:hypothetical protein ACFQ0B_35635 [Nonomuraea thailandensis]
MKRIILTALLLLTALAAPAHAQAGPGRLQIRGADVSSLAKSEALGGVYRDARGRRATRWPSCRRPGSTT